MQRENKIAYRYSDVCLVPRRGILESRSKADTSVKLGKYTFMLPVVPSNMRCTIDGQLAHTLSYEGYFYVMHRFLDNVAFMREAINKQHYISVSVGIKPEDRLFVKHAKENKIPIEYITLDIAHGHCLQALDMIRFIKDNLPETFIIAGNIATPEAALDLEFAGADALKVGIGQGNACITKDKTGFTMPMFTCVNDISRNTKLPIIADGGIRCNGDIAKAIAAGASMVMAGSLFAECSDSPSDIVTDEYGTTYKLYYGSASIHNKTDHKHIEGTLKKIPQNSLTYLDKLEEIRQDLASAISYSGGSSLEDLKTVNYCVYSS